MREKLKAYVSLLFAGTTGMEAQQEETLRRALEEYDRLIAAGYSETDSYGRVISGLSQQVPPEQGFTPMGKRVCTAIAVALYILCPIPLLLLQNVIGLTILLAMVACGVAIQILEASWIEGVAPTDPVPSGLRPILHTIAISLYVLCPTPLLFWQNQLGICFLLGMVAAGVAMQILAGSGTGVSVPKTKDPLSRSLESLLSLAIFAIYLVVSFRTGAWHLTWLIFPLGAAVKDLLLAVLELLQGKSSSGMRFVRAIVLVLLFAILSSALWRFRPLSFLDRAFFRQTSGLEQGSQEDSGSFDAGEVKSLRISWDSGKVILETGPQKDITFRMEGTGSQPGTYTQNGSELRFQSPAAGSVWKNLNHDWDLYITLPEAWSGREVRIDTVSGSVQISGLQAEELLLDTTSGSITASAIQSETVSVDTVSGSVHLEGSLEGLKLDTTSGSCEIELDDRIREIDMESISGNLDLTLPKDLGFDAEVDTVSGSFQSRIPTTSPSKGHYRSGNGRCEIDLESVSGSIQIHAK